MIETKTIPVSNNINRKLMITTVVLAAIAIIFSLYAKWVPILPGDLRLALLFQSMNYPGLTAVMEWASILFTSYPAILLTLAVGILIGWRIGKLEGIIVWAAGLLSLVNDFIKWVIDRPRPSPGLVRVIGINHGSGYPSGHTFFAIIFLGILAYILFTHVKSYHLKILSLTVLVLVNLLVAASRVYLGAHWPSDVLGGYIIGGLFLTLLIWLYEFLKVKFKQIEISNKFNR